MPKLEVSNLGLSYGTFEVLKDISLSLANGEVIVLLGSSGSGKTTLLRAIAGLETPNRGLINIDGNCVFNANGKVNLAPEKRDLGMVFQSYALWPHKTLGENIAYGLKLRGASADEARKRISETTSTLGLGSLLERYPNQLSGGQQQRVALARAIVYSAPVILLDEPLSNLDAQLREEAKTWLKRVMLEMKLSAVFVTHDQTEAMAMADRIILLANGRIEQQGTPQEVYDSPCSSYAANFFGINNNIEGVVERVEGNQVRFTSWQNSFVGIPVDKLRPGDPCKAVIKAESVTLGKHDAPGAIEFDKVASMYLGSRWEHLFRRGESLVRMFLPTNLDGQSFHLSFPQSAVRVFAS